MKPEVLPQGGFDFRYSFFPSSSFRLSPAPEQQSTISSMTKHSKLQVINGSYPWSANALTSAANNQMAPRTQELNGRHETLQQIRQRC